MSISRSPPSPILQEVSCSWGGVHFARRRRAGEGGAKDNACERLRRGSDTSGSSRSVLTAVKVGAWSTYLAQRHDLVVCKEGEDVEEHIVAEAE